MTTKFGKAFLRCGSTGRGCLSAVKKRRIDQLDLRLKELDSQPESKAVAPSSPGDQSGDAPCTAALPDHLPLDRQSESYVREGGGPGSLDVGGLDRWSRLLEPLVEALRRHVMAAEKL